VRFLEGRRITPQAAEVLITDAEYVIERLLE